MPTSARNDRGASRGFTFAEMLAALAILSLASLIAASAFNARSSRLVIDRAADALFSDLKLIRLRAEMRGEALELVGTPDGYRVTAEGVERRFPKGVTAQWNDQEEAILAIPLDPGRGGLNIRLSKGGVDATISIMPVTGRIVRVR